MRVEGTAVGTGEVRIRLGAGLGVRCIRLWVWGGERMVTVVMVAVRMRVKGGHKGQSESWKRMVRMEVLMRHARP